MLKIRRIKAAKSFKKILIFLMLKVHPVTEVLEESELAITKI